MKCAIGHIVMGPKAKAQGGTYALTNKQTKQNGFFKIDLVFSMPPPPIKQFDVFLNQHHMYVLYISRETNTKKRSLTQRGEINPPTNPTATNTTVVWCSAVDASKRGRSRKDTQCGVAQCGVSIVVQCNVVWYSGVVLYYVV